MSDTLTPSEQTQEPNQAAKLAGPATLVRTDIGYLGEILYFGLPLWLRVYRLGDDLRAEIWDGRPK